MDRPVLSLYAYFHRRRSWIFIALALLFTASVYFSAKIKFEENIYSILPEDEKIEKYKAGFQSFQLLDKLFVAVEWADAGNEPDPDTLTAYADDFVKNLNRTHGRLIKDITYRMPEDVMYKMLAMYFDHMPIFLDSADYDRIEEKISEPAIRQVLEKGYKTLVSPAGIFYKKLFIKDPLGLLELSRRKLDSMNLSPNLEFYKGALFTKDRKNLLLFITPANPPNETRENRTLVRGIDSTINELSQTYGGLVKTEYFGTVPIAVENSIRIKKDVIASIIFVVIIIFIIKFSSFKNKLYPFIIFLPIMVSGPTALAILYFYYGSISAISIGIASIIVGISVDYTILITTHYESRPDMPAVLGDVTNGIVLSCLTSAAGFLCLLFLKTQALHVIGLLASVVMIILAIISLIAVPHVLTFSENVWCGKKTNIAYKIGSYPYERSKVALYAILAVSLVTIFYVPRVRFDSDMENLNYRTSRSREAQKTFYNIFKVHFSKVLLISTGKNTQNALETNDLLAEKLSDLHKAGMIDTYSTISPLLPSRSTQRKKIQAWKSYWSTSKRKILKERLEKAGEKYGFTRAAFGRFMKYLEGEFTPLELDRIDDTIKNSVISDWIRESGSEDGAMVLSLCEIPQRNKDYVYKELRKIKDVDVFSKRDFADSLLEVIRSDYLLLVTLSIISILVILFLYYGGIALAIICFLPMGIGWIWALGIMGIFGFKFNIINIIASVFVFGLGTDYSIFVMEGLLQEHKYGRRNLDSYKTSVFLAAITSLVGIGVLVFAKHPALRSLGFTSIVGLTSVVILSFTIQPIMGRWLLGTAQSGKTLSKTVLECLFSVLTYSLFILGSFTLAIVIYPLMKITPMRRKTKDLIFHGIIMYFLRFMVYAVPIIRKRIINEKKETLEKPAVLISNHQSLIDILVMLMLHPKVLILTNDWVWNSPIFGKVVRYADYYWTGYGFESLAEKLEKKIKDGYSVAIFPEGTRSQTGEIQRFHKGAFYIAERLNLDILPIMIHGTRDCTSKGSFLVNSGTFTVKYLPRIPNSDDRYGADYSQKAKNIASYFKAEYAGFKTECETPRYFKNRLIKNYLYKGPVLEWYLRVKLALEDNYSLLNDLIPRDAHITDIGCGYGFADYMLSFLSSERKITGIDRDVEKCLIANNCFSKNGNLCFVNGEVTAHDFQKTDVFLMIDVLHYLEYKKQEEIMVKCADKLEPGGKVIIREADKNRNDRHRVTELLEWASTKGLRFNKSMDGQLYFSSRESILKCFPGNQFAVKIIEDASRPQRFKRPRHPGEGASRTSNVLYVFTKK